MVSEVPSGSRTHAPALDRSRVTVVVPTYNRVEGVRRCVEALARCDPAGASARLVVVDDGSLEDPAPSLEALRPALPGWLELVVERQPNQGAAAARSRGVARADTDLVFFLDDDCEPEPGWFRALLEVPWESGVGAAAGRIVSGESRGVVSRYCRHIRFNEFPPPEGPVRFVNTANGAYLRRAVEQVGGFERLFTSAGGEDHDLSRSVGRLGYALHYAPDAVVRHHHREDLRRFARAFRARGASTILRLVLWGERRPPGWSELAIELLRFGFRALRFLLIPIEAARLAVAGVPARDALPFAFIAWVQRMALRAGRITMLYRLVTGRQSLARTTTVPSVPEPHAGS